MRMALLPSTLPWFLACAFTLSTGLRGTSDASDLDSAHLEDATQVCKPATEPAFDLPALTTVNANQMVPPIKSDVNPVKIVLPVSEVEYTYGHPHERIVVCASGKGFLYTKRMKSTQHGDVYFSRRRDLTRDEISNFFSTLLSAWPRGADSRTEAEDGNFLFTLDAGSNLIAAPIMQGHAGDGGKHLKEVKHGDLAPSMSPFGHGDEAGFHRGAARFGGEFNLAGDRSGAEWVVHQKSGYALSRIPFPEMKKFFRYWFKQGKSDREIWDNVKSCMPPDPPVGLEGVAQLVCYMRSGLHIAMTPDQNSFTCRIASEAEDKAHGNLPVLSSCMEQGTASLGKGCLGSEDKGRGPLVTLVEWTPPGTCTSTVEDLDEEVQEVSRQVQRYRSEDPDDEGEVSGWFRSKLYKILINPCWQDKAISLALKCNLQACFAPGFHSSLKRCKKVAKYDGVRKVVQEWDRYDMDKWWDQCMGRA